MKNYNIPKIQEEIKDLLFQQNVIRERKRSLSQQLDLIDSSIKLRKQNLYKQLVADFFAYCHIDVKDKNRRFINQIACKTALIQYINSHSDLTLKQIGDLFNIDHSSVKYHLDKYEKHDQYLSMAKRDLNLFLIDRGL